MDQPELDHETMMALFAAVVWKITKDGGEFVVTDEEYEAMPNDGHLVVSTDETHLYFRIEGLSDATGDQTH